MATLRNCSCVGTSPVIRAKGCEHQSLAAKKLLKVRRKETRADVLSWRRLQQPEPEHDEVFVPSGNAGSSRRHTSAGALQFCVAAAKSQNVDLPKVLPKNRKKPFATPKRAIETKPKGRRLEPILRAPANGMLVRGLIPVAHRVMEAKAILSEGLSLLLKVIPVVRCRFCSEVHVSSVGHNLQTCLGPQNNRRQSRHNWVKASIDDVLVSVEAYHLEDRLAPPIGHHQRFDVGRISAVDELCIQAGYDDPNHPTKRYAKPALKFANRVNMESSYSMRADVPTLEDDGAREAADPIQQTNLEASSRKGRKEGVAVVETQVSLPLGDHQVAGNDSSVGEEDQASQEDEVDDEEMPEAPSQADDDDVSCSEEGSSRDLVRLTSEDDLQTVAQKTLRAWQTMRSGVRGLKRRYRTLACGYCPEVHVGPKGHRARVCGAFKHQQRDGRHGWQSATVDELIPPQYVWHMRDRDGPPLVNALRAFYGQAPAVVEICVQAGFPIPEAHRPMMRLDIAIPELDELEKVI